MLEQLPGLLLPWFAEHRRDLPWRRDREPYHVWLSEIMLQQTRVEAVRGYYLRFLERLPDIAALASAPEDVLLKLWEGLGYYSRVRNLQKAAQCVMEQHGGEFPRELSTIRALPGIGDYTAGAIASICFEAPTAAVDGNVLRVILRLTVCADSPADVRVRRRIGEELSAVYPAGHCGDFTQALMELGATVCLPNGAPQCGACPLRALCEAHAQGTELQFPTKPPKKPRRIEQRTVFVLQCGGPARRLQTSVPRPAGRAVAAAGRARQAGNGGGSPAGGAVGRASDRYPENGRTDAHLHACTVGPARRLADVRGGSAAVHLGG